MTKSFLEHGQHPQFVDLYEAVNEMVRSRVTNPVPQTQASDPQYDEGNQYTQYQNQSDLAIDQTVANIDEIWATLFGLSGSADGHVDRERDQSELQF